MNHITNVTLASISERDCVKIHFHGKFTKDEAVKASMQWKNFMKQINGDKKPVIFDCKQMTDYDPLARIVWQNTISELKSQIDSIWVVTDSKLIAAGASLLGLFSSLKIHTVNLESNIHLN
jgi:hypothetical protein